MLVAVGVASWEAGVGVPVTDPDAGPTLGVASVLLAAGALLVSALFYALAADTS